MTYICTSICLAMWSNMPMLEEILCFTLHRVACISCLHIELHVLALSASVWSHYSDMLGPIPIKVRTSTIPYDWYMDVKLFREMIQYGCQAGILFQFFMSKLIMHSYLNRNLKQGQHTMLYICTSNYIVIWLNMAARQPFCFDFSPCPGPLH